jgi:tetratricopeptide (TPR) repeat protein
MSRLRHVHGSILSATLVALFSVVVGAAAQENSVQKLLERGALDEAVARAGEQAGDPEAIYLAAFALIQKDDNGGAGGRFNQLREQGDESWRAIGESGAKLTSGDVGGAFESANRAVGANDGNPYAHFQLGLAAVKQENWERALQAFERSAELKPDFAYAHLFAGQSAQRLRQTAKMAEHFRTFLNLAPDAPERQGVQSLLRTVG